MTTASQKQLDYINSMIDSLETAEYFSNLESKLEGLRSLNSDEWSVQSKIQMFEAQVMDWHATLLNIRLRRNPMTLAELKAQSAQAIATLRSRIAAGLTSQEASKLIDQLKNKKLVSA